MIKQLFESQKPVTDPVNRKNDKNLEIERVNNEHKAIFAFGFYNNHVVRAPIVRILGLINLALLEQKHNHSQKEIREILLKIKKCAEELDEKTRRHNERIIK